jgi:hypothetical protein
LVAGPQDKKKSLDEFYATYDGAMPQESEWVQSFETTRDLIRSLLSPEEIRSWSGKSDFYTLFLALADFAKRKLSAQEKKAIRVELSNFRKQVDQAKKKDNSRQFASDIHEYAEAVTRAATDLGRREARLRILENRVKRALQRRVA